MEDQDTRPVAPDHLRLVQEVVWLWVQMQSRLQEHFAALAAEHSLSAIQAKILIQLDRNGPVTMRALAAQLQYDPSNLTSVIDRLEALGAVERHPDTRDRRVKKIILTATGDKLRAAFWQRITGDAGPLGALGAEELTQLRSLLQLAMAAQAEQTSRHPRAARAVGGGDQAEQRRGQAADVHRQPLAGKHVFRPTDRPARSVKWFFRRGITPKVPQVQVPGTENLPKPEELVASAYDFAEQLLASQRRFAEEVVKATSSLRPSDGTDQ